MSCFSTKVSVSFSKMGPTSFGVKLTLIILQCTPSHVCRIPIDYKCVFTSSVDPLADSGANWFAPTLENAHKKIMLLKRQALHTNNFSEKLIKIGLEIRNLSINEVFIIILSQPPF